MTEPLNEQLEELYAALDTPPPPVELDPQAEALIAVVRELLERQVQEIIAQRRLLERIARAVEAREAPRSRELVLRPAQPKTQGGRG